MIRLVDLNEQHRLLHKKLQDAFNSVIERGQFILGSQIRELEAAFAAHHDCQYGIGVSSCTDALIISLKALDIGPGDEVILPAMTFCATAEAVCLVGARPVLVDVEQKTLGLDPILTKAAITGKTKAIIPVHLHGWPVPLAPFLAMSEQNGIAIVEDCAQAHGAKEKGYPVGSRTTAGCFSFFPAKNLGALGDGGMLITNDPIFAERVRSLANHGRREKHVSEEIGYNSRLDELQAAFLNVKLPHLETWNEQRRTLAARYNQAFVNLPFQIPHSWEETRTPCFHLYVIKCITQEIRTRLAHFLKTHDVQTGIHYPIPLHLQPALKFLNYEQGCFPVSEWSAQHMLSLPIYPGMTIEQQDYVIQKVVWFMENMVSDK